MKRIIIELLCLLIFVTATNCEVGVDRGGDNINSDRGGDAVNSDRGDSDDASTTRIVTGTIASSPAGECSGITSVVAVASDGTMISDETLDNCTFNLNLKAGAAYMFEFRNPNKKPKYFSRGLSIETPVAKVYTNTKRRFVAFKDGVESERVSWWLRDGDVDAVLETSAGRKFTIEDGSTEINLGTIAIANGFANFSSDTVCSNPGNKKDLLCENWDVNTPVNLEDYGNINPDGVYTAPEEVPEKENVIIVARDIFDKSLYGSADVYLRDINNWERLTADGGYQPRDSAELFFYDGAFWLSNGWDGITPVFNDLWRSFDGVVWEEVKAETPYDNRSQIIIYNNRMFAINTSVWSSEDGEYWELLTDRTPFVELLYDGALVYDGKIWVFGPFADVWYSTNGVNWVEANSNAPYGERYAFDVVVFKNKMCLLGGASYDESDPPERAYYYLTTYNDMWCTQDGRTWTLVAENCPWSPRMWLCAVGDENRLWVLGGFDNRNYKNISDTWYTRDGVIWNKLDMSIQYEPRHAAGCAMIDNMLYVVAGNSWPLTNDTWRFEYQLR